MDWQTEVNNSLSWTLTALLGVSAVLAVLALALKRTDFGQRFWLITQPCVQTSSAYKIIGLLLLLLTLILLEVRISVLNSFFYNGLYTSLQEQKADTFWFFAGLNALLVMFKIVHSIINYFVRQLFEIRWLEKLNNEMLVRWLRHKNS